MCPSERNQSPPAETSSHPELRSAFEVLDADCDGKISGEDLRRFYAGCCNGNGSGFDDDEMIETMISVADVNKDGFVEYEEFENVLGLSKTKETGFRVIMEDVFKVMDKDGDGKLSHQDLKSFMEWVGFTATDDDINEMISLGCGGDGGSGKEQGEGVSFDGLLRILAVDFAG